MSTLASPSHHPEALYQGLFRLAPPHARTHDKSRQSTGPEADQSSDMAKYGGDQSHDRDTTVAAHSLVANEFPRFESKEFHHFLGRDNRAPTERGGWESMRHEDHERAQRHDGITKGEIPDELGLTAQGHEEFSWRSRQAFRLSEVAAASNICRFLGVAPTATKDMHPESGFRRPLKYTEYDARSSIEGPRLLPRGASRLKTVSLASNPYLVLAKDGGIEFTSGHDLVWVAKLPNPILSLIHTEVEKDIQSGNATEDFMIEADHFKENGIDLHQLSCLMNRMLYRGVQRVGRGLSAGTISPEQVSTESCGRHNPSVDLKDTWGSIWFEVPTKSGSKVPVRHGWKCSTSQESQITSRAAPNSVQDGNCDETVMTGLASEEHEGSTFRRSKL